MNAVREGKIADLRAALEADPKTARHPGPIVEAARAGFLPGLKLLLKSGADPNAIWKNYRPLHAVMQTGAHRVEPATPQRLACLDWLLTHGASPLLAAGWPSARALLIAAFTGEPGYVAGLDGAAPSDGFVAAALGDRKALSRFARRAGFASETNESGLTALHCAAASRLDPPAVTACARLLLDAGAEVRALVTSWDHQLDAAYFAAGAHNLALFQLLLERGADPTEALTHAAWGAGIEFCELALAHGAQPDGAVSDGKPLLNHLIAWGQVTPALWLLAQGASPNLPDSRGWTATHQAASRGNRRLLQAVLDAGGDPSALPEKQ